MKKKNYMIHIDGCDACTIFEMQLTDKEAELIKRVSELSIATSTFSCMPIMRIVLDESNNTKK